MKRKAFFKAGGSILAGVSSLLVSAQQQKLPNIILIYTDDQGYADLGCYGAKGFRTPNIDSLAANGIRFTDFYAPQAVSSASRAGLLTGCYPNRVGIAGALMPKDVIGINENEVTIAEMLKKKGYATAIYGKWHLGWQKSFLPANHGFDEYYGIPYSIDMLPMEYDGSEPAKGSQRSNYPELPLIHNTLPVAGLKSLSGIDTLTRFLTEKSLQFIDNHKEKPFFIYFPHPMPHTPLAVSEKFRNSTAQGKYGDVISEIDWSVGQLVDKLKKEGLLENTLLIFTSDNGPWLNFGTHAGSAGVLREGKGTSWEGGQRVPCVMYWKNRIPAGISCEKIASAIDILPTLAEITGAELPKNKIDGKSILPLMKGIKDAEPRKVFLYYYEVNQLQAIRYGDWKLVFPHTSRSYLGVEAGKNGMPGPYNVTTCGKELYNLKDDISETVNVIDKYPEVVHYMDSLSDMAREDLGDFLQNKKGKNNRAVGIIKRPEHKLKHKALGCNVKYETSYSLKYDGGGESALTDGNAGYTEYQNKAWQGFEKIDFKGIISLKKSIMVKEITVGFLQDENSWIFSPTQVVVEYSEDGIQFYPYGNLSWENYTTTPIPNRLLAKVTGNHKAKYLRIQVQNTGICPPEHPGKGKPAWLFIDEIMVK
jgi:arylsulfatase